MALDGPQFLRAVMDQLGVNTAGDLAEKMGWKRGFERTVARWIAGDNEPSYGYVMEMIDKTGWARTAQETRPLTEDEATQIRALQAELAGLLQRLQELTGQ